MSPLNSQTDKWDYFAPLPNDVKKQIFKFLDFKSLQSASVVCKNFNALVISDEHFSSFIKLIQTFVRGTLNPFLRKKVSDGEKIHFVRIPFPYLLTASTNRILELRNLETHPFFELKRSKCLAYSESTFFIQDTVEKNVLYITKDSPPDNFLEKIEEKYNWIALFPETSTSWVAVMEYEVSRWQIHEKKCIQISQKSMDCKIDKAVRQGDRISYLTISCTVQHVDFHLVSLSCHSLLEIGSSTHTFASSSIMSMNSRLTENFLAINITWDTGKKTGNLFKINENGVLEEPFNYSGHIEIYSQNKSEWILVKEESKTTIYNENMKEIYQFDSSSLFTFCLPYFVHWNASTKGLTLMHTSFNWQTQLHPKNDASFLSFMSYGLEDLVIHKTEKDYQIFLALQLNPQEKTEKANKKEIEIAKLSYRENGLKRSSNSQEERNSKRKK